LLILDIETFQICGKSSIWDFAAIDSATGEYFHFMNAPMVAKANQLLRDNFNVRFFEAHHVNYCLSNQTAKRLNNKEFFEAIQALINSQKCISAYNLNFDYKELKKQCITFPERQKKVCLWGSFINAYVNHKYVKYCYDNNYISEKGYIRTNAETAFRYISGHEDYIHEHMALADCWSELEIWEGIVKRKQKLESSCSFANVKKAVKKLGY
jgi:hypothetical protein